MEANIYEREIYKLGGVNEEDSGRHSCGFLWSDYS